MRKSAEAKRAYERKWRRDKAAHDPEYLKRKQATDAAWRKRHLLAFAKAKMERGCDRCGFNACAQALQYHHRDPAEKLYDLGRWSPSIGKAKLAEEIAKCDLLCANCHAMEHCSGGCCNGDI